METKVYANLLQGMDSFLRIAMTLRRRELKLKSLSMSTDCNEMVIVLNEQETSSQSVLNHMQKLCDVGNVRVVVG
ncbi:MAG: ACT domain-containing protein [Peptoniphilus sp.]|uniref:ACT domain-containing protein n=2 Tax=Peptoniphilus indolicus TaxID=33030 RepID=G4D4D0_9FIRM|nr:MULTISPECIES: ACT domain-containing protein [Peptoniphilus]EGY79614.1 hypothetical protein HMPREF9129_1260 [Peptoniphilus indolicus ATCC 29427]MDY2986259.1 ACT domain-containing protein [Peptoniphilus sp.]SUB75944.1 Uncharacterised protein [Peptoniphilus indolicus]